eukprot:5790539-Amphidinium_carterae.3
MSVDVGGHLKAVNSVLDFSADVSMALTRRSLALDQFDLLSFHDMEEWSDFLFELLHRDVPPHLHVTLPQLHEADRQLFVIAASLLKHGSIAKDGDFKPVADALQCARKDRILLAFLAPVPKELRKRAAEGSSSSQVPLGSKRTRPASSGSKGKGRDKVRSAVASPAPLSGHQDAYR